ncbi:hypothetical protein HG530_000850 [Fusarium avenaceum]|nr:hypothetical protein HG530_000850 [Fusarium avenaceum]
MYYASQGSNLWYKSLRIVDENVDVPPLLGQIVHDAFNLDGVAHIKLKRQNLDTITDLALDLLREFLERISTTCCEDQTKVILGRCPGKLQSRGASDAGGGAGDKDGLAGKTFGSGRSHGATSEESTKGRR